MLVKAQHKIHVEKIKRFGGTVSETLLMCFSRIPFPTWSRLRQAGLRSLKSTPERTVQLVSFDWLPACIAERKVIPTRHFEVKRFQVETTGEISKLPRDPINKEIRFNISGTSKFAGSSHTSTWPNRKEVFLRRTLAYGTYFGTGVFCLTDEGKQQIGWVPEKDQAILDAVGKACELPNFYATIYNTSAKSITDKFTKTTISIISEAL